MSPPDLGQTGWSRGVPRDGDEVEVDVYIHTCQDIALSGLDAA